MNNLLRNPNLLNLASFFTAGVGIAVMVMMILAALVSQNNKAISASTLEDSSVSVSGESVSGLDFDQTFRVSGSGAKFSWGKNLAVGVAGAEGTFNRDRAHLKSGTFYIQADNLQLTVGDQTGSTVTLNQFSGAILADEAVIVVMAGTARDSAGSTYGQNQELKINSNGGFQSGTFLRQSLSTKPIWESLTKAVTDLGVSQPWLSDRTAPKLTKITPEAGNTIPANLNPVPFVIEVDDPGAKISINGVEGVVSSDGKYSTSINLNPGTVTLTIVIEDKYGNLTQTGASYTKLGSSGNQPPTATGCNLEFSKQLFILINSYRSQSGKPGLSLEEELSRVACTHTQWMVSVKCDSNTQNCAIGKAGDTFTTRCQAAQTSCTAENLVAGGATTPEAALNIWKQLSTFNQNLTGDFSQIGIGASEGYVTVLFK